MNENAQVEEQSRPAWQGMGAALLVGAVAGVVWFAVHTPVESPPVAANAPIAVKPVAVTSAAQSGADFEKILHVEPAADAAPAPVPEGHVRVCGQDIAQEAIADDQLEQTLHAAGAAAALEAFAREHLGDSDHARAVGLVLRMQADADYRDAPDRLSACKSDDCWKRESRAHAERVAPLLTALAELADVSADPRVMMLAREQCHILSAGATALPHCQQLSARRLVALDRDNAAAWLALAAEEPAAIDEAMYQAALARRWDDYATSARRFIERVDAKGGLRSIVIVQALMAVPALRSIEGQQLMTQRCGARRVAADANQHQLCEQLAVGLHERSHSVLGRVTAAIVAQALGHPRAQAWQDESRLLSHVLLVQGSDIEAQARDAQGCAVGMPRELLLRSAREGEVPALRALMQASGKSETQWRDQMLASEAAQKAAQEAATRQAQAQMTETTAATVSALR
jgi:hypothetical protein